MVDPANWELFTLQNTSIHIIPLGSEERSHSTEVKFILCLTWISPITLAPHHSSSVSGRVDSYYMPFTVDDTEAFNY